MAVPAAAAHIVKPRPAFKDSVLWTACAGYAVVYFFLGWLRYAVHANFVDLGIFTQTAVSAFGCFCNPVEGSHWAVHFSPILYLAGAILQVWRSPLALVAFQAVAGALTAPPIYGIVRRYADREAALMAAFVVLLYPPLGGVIFNDFHENGLAPAAVAWTLWAFDGGLIAAAWIFALLTLAIKEDQAIFLAIAGIGGAIAYRGDRSRLRFCQGVALLALVVLALYFLWIQPHANQTAQWAPLRFFGVSQLDLGRRIGFVLLAFVPLLFIPFRTWAVVVAIVPLAEALLSSMSTTYTMGSHYAGAWTGYVMFAFALGIAAIAESNLQRAHRLLYWCIALCITEFAVADPLHPGYFLHAPMARDAHLDRLSASLPANLDVATQEEAYTHLAAADPRATLVPELSPRALRSCYVLLDREFPQSARLEEYDRYASHVRGYIVAEQDGGIILYKSRHCAPPIPQLRPAR